MGQEQQAWGGGGRGTGQVVGNQPNGRMLTHNTKVTFYTLWVYEEWQRCRASVTPESKRKNRAVTTVTSWVCFMLSFPLCTDLWFVYTCDLFKLLRLRLCEHLQFFCIEWIRIAITEPIFELFLFFVQKKLKSSLYKRTAIISVQAITIAVVQLNAGISGPLKCIISNRWINFNAHQQNEFNNSDDLYLVR